MLAVPASECSQMMRFVLTGTVLCDSVVPEEKWSSLRSTQFINSVLTIDLKNCLFTADSFHIYDIYLAYVYVCANINSV